MSTKALAVKRALRDMLTGLPLVVSDGLVVLYGLPARDIERRFAFVGETRWESSDWATNRSRTEEFVVTVGFGVTIAGGTLEEAEDYTITLAGQFEAALAANPSLGGLCISSSYQPRRVNTWPVDGASQAQFETEVRATCRP